jgi:hypothetical protein
MFSRPNERPLAWGASLACPHRRQTHGDRPIAAPAKPVHVMPHGTVEVLLPSPIEHGAGSGEFHCEAIRQWICHRAANPRASRGRENGEASWDVVRKGDVSFVKRLGRRKGKGLRVNGGALASVCSIDAMQRQRQPAALVRRERGAI